MINIKNLKVKKNHNQWNSFNTAGMKKTLIDRRKNCTIVLNSNSLDIDLIKSMLKYRKKLNYQWKKGKNTDSLFLYIQGDNHEIIKFLKKYNNNLIGLTYKEKKELNNIRKNSYISLKYSFKAITDNEYGYYEPIKETDNYNDYDNIKNQSVFYNKRINYEKTEKNMKTIDTTLNHCINILNNFKLSDLNVDLSNGIPFIEIFNKRLKACEYRLKRNYWRVQDRYINYDDFIKSIVHYGASHHRGRWWQIIKRELY